MKTTILALAITAISTTVGTAIASTTFHPSSDEPGTTVQVVPGTITKAERESLDRAEAATAQGDWVYRGGEAGWELSPHSYDFRGGRLEHSDRIPHDTPTPVLNRAGSTIYQQLERE